MPSDSIIRRQNRRRLKPVIIDQERRVRRVQCHDCDRPAVDAGDLIRTIRPDHVLHLFASRLRQIRFELRPRGLRVIGSVADVRHHQHGRIDQLIRAARRVSQHAPLRIRKLRGQRFMRRLDQPIFLDRPLLRLQCQLARLQSPSREIRHVRDRAKHAKYKNHHRPRLSGPASSP